MKTDAHMHSSFSYDADLYSGVQILFVHCWGIVLLP